MPLAADQSADLPRHSGRQLYYGWVCVVVASLAMTATLPGRTYGLGLITEPLRADLKLNQVAYADINLCCTLLGAAFCIPIGVLIDRYGVRLVLTTVSALLGLSVLALTHVQTPTQFFWCLLFIRGFGQGALSVVSMAIVGKWFRRRLGAAMALFAVLLTIGFIISILGMGEAVKSYGWRSAWNGLGWFLLGFAVFSGLVTRDSPEACGLAPDDEPAPTGATQEIAAGDFTVWEALRTPAFWIFSAGTASFNLVWSSITLFNENIMAEKKFDAGIAVQIMAILTGMGLLSNFLAGAIATRDRLGKLLGVGLGVLAVALAMFPAIQTVQQVRLYAIAMGLTGGIVMVVFFAVWGSLFGRAQLGRIQSVAQIISVFASAAGPELLARGRAASGSYDPVFSLFAIGVGIVAVAALVVPLPRRQPASFTHAAS